MSRDDSFAKNSLLYRHTKLLCPHGHGLQPVLGTDSDLALLECGCARADSLPVSDGRISVEHVNQFASAQDQKKASQLFPGDIGTLPTVRKPYMKVRAA